MADGAADGVPDGLGQGRPPRLLVTGFTAFPGAPVNPTEALIAELTGRGPPAGVEAFRAVVLPVEYDGVETRLGEAAMGLDPDIAIHFGLAAGARGFRLERIAKNSLEDARPDNAGRMPGTATVCAGPDELASTLPLAAIAARLGAEGFPVEWSDDAGGYLCNVVFMLSRAHACDGLAPAMSGFVHVPGEESMTADALTRGAVAVIDTCIGEWTAGQVSGQASEGRL